jgi:hypothetical protein
MECRVGMDEKLFDKTDIMGVITIRFGVEEQDFGKNSIFVG